MQDIRVFFFFCFCLGGGGGVLISKNIPVIKIVNEQVISLLISQAQDHIFGMVIMNDWSGKLGEVDYHAI